MPKTKVSLIDLGKLSKPATKLIEAVSAAIGVLYEPTRIKKRAAAEADAWLIQTKAEAQAKTIKVRAARRLFAREMRRQENIETITEKALVALPAEVSEDAAEPDWIFQFFETCQDVSDSTMQEVWARILAGEIAEPGGYSRRTLMILRTLGTRDANSFSKLRTLIWKLDGQLFPIVQDTDRETVKRHIKFAEFLHLSALGLINFNSPIGYKLTYSQNRFLAEYYDRYFLCTLSKNEIASGGVTLTSAGSELMRVVTSSPDYGYMDDAIEFLEGQGIVIEQLKTGKK